MSGSATGPGDNRLATSSSPYLRLHRRNPVDWYPWGEEAIRRAQEEDRPLFVSIGYSTCFWCHVMERESFSDPGIAALMNESFVNVKIDREERPDLDDIYMAATQIFSGHGGWPNSVFLTPDLEPFFAGTYFPPESRHGQPGFPAVLKSLAEAWQTRREDVKVQAASLADAVRRSLDGRAEPLHGLGGAEAVERAVAALGRRFDPTWGGFSGAPKFPSPGNLILLHERAAEDPKADGMLSKTLDQMARGGIYDQLAGGFHRYSVDGEWRVPHFEKMLHDNGLLLEIYAREAARLGVETPDGAERARIARETAEFLLTGMRHPDEPAFRAAIDAETEGEEGAYYVWRREELLAVLGDEDFGFLAPLLGFDGAPNFEEGRYVLHRPEPTAAQASRRQRTAEQLEAEMAPLRRRLEAARAERKAPAIDEKILADWNGMAVAGLATAGRVLEEPSWIGAAAEAARFVLERLRRADGTLAHSWAAGQPGAGAFLADYAFLLRGLLALDEADSEGGWSERAVSLAEEAVERLSAPAGGFYGAAPAADLLARGRDVIGGAVPSGNGVMAIALADLGDRTGDERWTNLGAATVRSVGGLLGRAPDAAPVLALAAARLGLEATEDPDRSRSIEAVRATLDLGDPDEEGWRSFSLGFELEPGFRLEEQSEGQLIGIGSRGAETREVVGAEGEGLGLSGELRTLTPGATIEITYAVCDDDRCLLPVTRIIPIA